MMHLVIGGARSGKSRFAEKLASDFNFPVTYIATATVGDDEMRERIDIHQASRPQNWRLIEEPFYLSQVIENNDAQEQVLIIECMTLWLSNWLCTNDKENWQSEKQAFIDALLKSKAQIIIVSNEVGSGIVPLGELSRDFVDQAGWLNQALAQISKRTTLVVAGCPISLNPTDGFSENSNAN